MQVLLLLGIERHLSKLPMMVLHPAAGCIEVYVTHGANWHEHAYRKYVHPCVSWSGLPGMNRTYAVELPRKSALAFQ